MSNRQIAFHLGLLIILISLGGLYYQHRTGPGAIDTLVDQLKNENESVRRNAAETLAKMGPTALKAAPALVLALNDPHYAVATAAGEALQKIDLDGGQAAVAGLIDQIKEAPQMPAPEHPMWVLSSIGPTASAALPALIAASHSPDAPTRAAALMALPRIDPTSREAAAALQTALKDPDKTVRMRAAETIGLLLPATAKSVEALTNVMHDPDWNVRFSALNSFKEMGDGAIAATPQIKRMMDEWNKSADVKDHSLAGQAQYALYYVKSPYAPQIRVKTLLQMLHDDRHGTLEFSLRGLAKHGQGAKIAVPDVVLIIQKGDKLARYWGALFLGLMGPAAEEAVPALAALCDGDSRVVRLRVEWAIRQIAANEALAQTCKEKR